LQMDRSYNVRQWLWIASFHLGIISFSMIYVFSNWIHMTWFLEWTGWQDTVQCKYTRKLSGFQFCIRILRLSCKVSQLHYRVICSFSYWRWTFRIRPQTTPISHLRLLRFFPSF
jgi:hypothetical protein